MQALEVYDQIQRHGWELVQALRTFRLTEHEAEALLVRLDWLSEHLPQLRAQFWGETQSQAQHVNGQRVGAG